MHWIVAEQAPVEYTVVPAALSEYRVRGDSMEPLARDGQIVLVDGDTPPKDGDLAIVEFEDDTSTFKRVYRRGPTWFLMPINPAYPPAERPASDIRQAWQVWGVKF